MNNKKETVCVTGGAGFIGSNLVKKLLDENYRVDVFDNMSNGRLEFFAVEQIGVDDVTGKNVLHHIKLIFEKEAALKNIRTGCYSKVFHLAANPRPALSIEDPLTSYDDNVRLSLEFLDACRECQETHDENIKFIFASSSAVYGEGASDGPSTEGEYLAPVSPYGLEKKNVEEMMKLYSKLYGLNSVALRYFNVYGKNQLASPKYPCVVAEWIDTMLYGGVVQINGMGKISRDFIHVDDVVDATIAAAELEIQKKFDVFNVGSGVSKTLEELYSILQKITNFDPVFRLEGSIRPGDVQRTQASITAMKKELGVEPKSLQTGLQETYNWAKDSWIFKNLKINI